MLDWDLLRFFIALRRHGSMSAAARALEVDQTTVGRRVAALEDELGVQLFRRTQGGYLPTHAAEEIMESALAAEAAVSLVERRLLGQDARLEGRVRVTVTDVMATPLLQSLREFRASHPAVELELLVDNRRLDLGRGEADLSIRMARPREPQVLARRMATMGLGLYASASYLRRRPPVRPGQLDGHDVLCFASEIALSRDRWVIGALRGGTVVVRTNNLLSLSRACAADLGVAVLPCLLGDADPRLVRIGPPRQVGEIWLAQHQALRDNARVRAVHEHVARFLARLAPELAGRPA